MARRSRFLVVGVIAALLLSVAPQSIWGGSARAAGNPFAGIHWVSNAPPQAQQMGITQQTVDWIGGWFDISTMASYVNQLITTYESQGGTPIFAVYNVPNRDCGGFSQGGATNASEYQTWVGRFAAAIGQHKAIVLIEPDGLTATYCLDASHLNERYSLISYAVGKFKANPNATVYIDGGNHGYWGAVEAAPVLQSAGIAQADGFFLNSTLYHYTTAEVAFGRALSAQLGVLGIPSKHFVVDTSRNGLGTAVPDTWCNAPGRALGVSPTEHTGEPLADAFIWLKPVWQSDGDCGRGEPGAGQNYYAYLAGLIQRAAQPFSDVPAFTGSADDPEYVKAIHELALRGIIRGNGDGTFGPNSPTLRAQMAALIARPVYLEIESWKDVNFSDQGVVDADLWRNVRTLAHYGIAKGYSDGTFNPTGPVLYEQVILFISRAMVQRGYWQPCADDPKYFPNLPGNTDAEKADRADIATYVCRTQNQGGVPDRPATGNFTNYDQPAPRVWFAVALYRALKSAYLP
jgi:endoglucanase